MDKPKHSPEKGINMAGQIFGRLFLNKHMAGIRNKLKVANWIKPQRPDAWKGTTFFPPNKRDGDRECRRRLKQIMHRAERSYREGTEFFADYPLGTIPKRRTHTRYDSRK